MNSRLIRLYLSSVVLIAGFVCPEIHAFPWFPFGPDGGDARSFAADPRDPAHLYLGTANGWIYQSRDGGRKWVRLANVGRRDDLVIDHILVDPADPKHLVVGAQVLADGGLFISQDGGATWTSQPQMRGQSVRALSAAPSDPKILVAGTLDGVYRSTDGGGHWQSISKGANDVHEIASLAIDPVDPNTIYAGTWHLPWKTTDGGVTWKNIKQGIIEDSDVFSILVDPKRPNVVYLSACSGIYKSEDGGGKFVKAPGIPTSARRTRVLTQDPNHLDTVFAGTTEGLYRSGEAGKLWAQTTGSDVIVNDVYVDPADSNHVLLATDRQGVLASTDGGSSFVEANSGFSARQIYAYTGDVQHPATLYVGVVNDKQWGGVFVSHTGGLSWSQLPAGLEGRDVFSLGQAPDGTIVAGTGHGIYRLKDAMWRRVGDEAGVAGPAGGRTTARKAGVPLPRPRVARPAARPGAAALKSFDGSVYGFAVTGETLYAATSAGMLRSGSSGLTWSRVASLAMDEYRFLAAARSYVAAASLDAVELSADGGKTWQPVRLPEKVTQVSALSVDGQGGVWVAGREGVYHSADEGASWQTPKGLNVRDANCIFYDGAADRVLVTSGEMTTTVAFAVQLPAMQVSSWDTGWNLRFVRPVGDHLVAGTLFDGIVVQPRMVESPEPGATTATR